MKLAIRGGSPVRTKPFPGNDVIGREEREAVLRVLDSRILSGFYGSWDAKFYGGPEIKALEEEWASYFGARHAIAVNSATSGLQCAIGAAGVGPGDEVIVSPYTMCASATAPLIYGAIPVFADIHENSFCLDPESIASRMSERTTAIVAVDIFGHPIDADRIKSIAKRSGAVVIEDAAQAPGAKYRGRFAGTLADIGVFSLNYHKHIHCGEGGVVVTNDDSLAERVRLIRNHAEAVVGPKGEANLVNMVGFNFRMTEIEAAIARTQLTKLSRLLTERQERVEYLNRKLAEIPCLTPPSTAEECEHAYYVHAIKFDESKAGVNRDRFIDALCAELSPMTLKEDEGICLWGGYVAPLYLLPLFQKKVAFGSSGFPWSSFEHGRSISYEKGLCPIAERMYEQEVILHEYVTPFMTQEDLDDLVAAFAKVWDHRAELA